MVLKPLPRVIIIIGKRGNRKEIRKPDAKYTIGAIKDMAINSQVTLPTSLPKVLHQPPMQCQHHPLGPYLLIHCYPK